MYSKFLRCSITTGDGFVADRCQRGSSTDGAALALGAGGVCGFGEWGM